MSASGPSGPLVCCFGLIHKPETSRGSGTGHQTDEGIYSIDHRWPCNFFVL